MSVAIPKGILGFERIKLKQIGEPISYPWEKILWNTIQIDPIDFNPLDWGKGWFSELDAKWWEIKEA